MKFITKLFSILFLMGFLSVNLVSARSKVYGQTSATTVSIQPGSNLAIADTLFSHILEKYEVKKHGLLSETYPVNPENKVTYLAEGTAQQRSQEVSFLWPYSGMLSGGIALYKKTADPRYLTILKEKILPGLEKYWDDSRTPACYQSYPGFNGESDRFYDDNDWIAIDFCDLYTLTADRYFLEKAEKLHAYIFSGWDDLLGGGIYWCEQKKTSKNTCSNAPTAVLCMKLYQLTKKENYLEQAKKIYAWTKENLRDPEDFVYWDNIRLNGKVDKAKYSYNSGQMIQAAVLLFQQSNDSVYLKEAQVTAANAFQHFTRMQQGIDGTEDRFFNSDPWFNVIFLRGLTALYEIDRNPLYIRTMKKNARYAWTHTRDKNGFLDNDWSGIKTKPYKWLLDNACMVELFVETDRFSE